MKTADLIPFILLELNESNKYGFELTKAIENKSNGKIIIKQPTLYTLLKKLEKSKFITSYWEDSEIGGKRHYYKLTENGKLQVSTLPSYDFLLKNAIENEFSIENENNEEKSSSAIKNLTPSAPSETILPAEEVFADNNIDNSTELEINSSNLEILKNDPNVHNVHFASNNNVSKFTERVVSPSAYATTTEEKKSEFKEQDLFNIDFSVPKNDIDVKYVNYVDFKNTKSYKDSKAITKKLILQALATSGALIFVALLCYLITSFTGRSALFYCFFIPSLLVALFYPLTLLANMENIRLTYQTKSYNTKTKFKLYIGLTAVLTVLVLCIIVNICIKKNTFGLILTFKNFANFYAPLLLTATYFLDILYNHLFLSKLTK